MSTDANNTHVCPWWLGYFLITPLRKFFQHPDRILSPYVREGMTVLEIGPGMGYFSLSLARLVGATGVVMCVDVQARMLRRLEKRAEKAGLHARITTIQASTNSLRLGALKSAADFVLAFAIVHEVPDQKLLCAEISGAMSPGACSSFPNLSDTLRRKHLTKRSQSQVRVD